MAILAADMKQAMAASLGVAGTQRYLDQQHYIPAINAGMRRFNGLCQSVFAESKGTEEFFREITETRIFQTNLYGGITLSQSQLGHPVWTIVGIYPEPVHDPATIIPAPDAQSLYRDDVTLRRFGRFPCRRITMEQVSITERNRYLPGNEVLASGPQRSYAYVILGDRSGPDWQPGDVEVQVLPGSISGLKLMGVSYLKGVTPITSMADTIPYPSSSFQLIRDLSLNEITFRQGARPLYDVTIDQVRSLLMAQA